MLRNLIWKNQQLFLRPSQSQLLKPIFNLHTTCIKSGTHDYEAVDVLLNAKRHKEATGNESILNQAASRSGAVVRWKKVEGEMLLDEDPVLVVGRPFQIKAATDVLLNGVVEDTENVDSQDERLVWHGYKRNFKGQFPPEKPRKTCIRNNGNRVSGNPCPLCQIKLKSSYNVHFTDVQLLEQFICPHTAEILSPKVTGICKKQHLQVEAAIKKARNFGYLPFTLPLHSKEQGKHIPAGIPTDKKIKVKMH